MVIYLTRKSMKECRSCALYAAVVPGSRFDWQVQNVDQKEISVTC